MKVKLLMGMLCIGLWGFTACDDEDEITASPSPAALSTGDNSNPGGPQSGDDVSLEGGSVLPDTRRESIDINGKYFISYFENGTETGGVDITSQYKGYIFTIDNRRLIVSGNDVNLVGTIRIDEGRRMVEMMLPPNDKLNDLDPIWSLNELTPGIIGMATPFMDAPRDAMILTKVPEQRVVQRRE